MNALAWAKKLRARQKTLRARHARELKAFADAFELWKQNLEHWIRDAGVKNVRKLTRGQVRAPRYRSDNWSESVMRGHPEPPARPSDETIRSISLALRHLAITGQKTIQVTPDDVRRYFGDESEDDE